MVPYTGVVVEGTSAAEVEIFTKGFQWRARRLKPT